MSCKLHNPTQCTHRGATTAGPANQDIRDTPLGPLRRPLLRSQITDTTAATSTVPGGGKGDAAAVHAAAGTDCLFRQESGVCGAPPTANCLPVNPVSVIYLSVTPVSSEHCLRDARVR